AITGRQLAHSLVDRQPVDHRDSPCALNRRLDHVREVAFFACVFELYAALAKVHQYLVYRQAVQPGCEGRIASKASELSVDLQEDFLCKILRLAWAAHHSQAERIDPAVMLFVKPFKRRRIPSRCSPG